MATRTWVSGVGDDVNPCSRTAPCKTFAGAISKTAARGEISVLDPGGFGALTITKGMTIDGGEGSGFASILASFSNGIVVNAGASDVVTIRNISINGADTGVTGIRILSAAQVFIENCEIFGFRSTGGGDSGRAIRDARTAGGQLFVTGCTIRNNLQQGIFIQPSTGSTRISATIDNCWIQSNGNAGVNADGGCLVTISNSILTGHAGVGVAALQSAGATEVNIENCVIAHNGTGILSTSGTPTTRVSNSTIVNNTTGIQISSGVVRSYVNNRIAGNGSGNAPSAGQNITLQ